MPKHKLDPGKKAGRARRQELQLELEDAGFEHAEAKRIAELKEPFP